MVVFMLMASPAFADTISYVGNLDNAQDVALFTLTVVVPGTVDIQSYGYGGSGSGSGRDQLRWRGDFARRVRHLFFVVPGLRQQRGVPDLQRRRVVSSRRKGRRSMVRGFDDQYLSQRWGLHARL